MAMSGVLLQVSPMFGSRQRSRSYIVSAVHPQFEPEITQFFLGGSKTTSVASSTWKRFVRAGDSVVDATVGNGNDTLQLAKLVYSDTTPGCVYGFDVQQTALDRTSRLLDEQLSPEQRKHVRLFHQCHSKMEETLEGIQPRLVAFNLGYLPYGNKELTTSTPTTIQALESSIRILQPGGIISIVAYVGHSGGREEYEAIKDVAISLPASEWTCSHVEHWNRPLGPHLVFLVKKS